MAGMSIIVCLPGAAAPRVDEAVAEAMKPFARDGEGAVERDVWDTYRICGGTVGLPVKAGHEDDPRLIATRPHGDGTPDPDLPGVAAGAPRGLVDFRDALRAEVAEHAGRVWDRWQEVAARHPGAEHEEAFYRRHLASGGTPATYPTSREAAAYQDQPAVRAWAEVAPALARPDLADHLRFSWNPMHIGRVSREDYAAGVASALLPDRNVLTLGGWWYELGEDPLHGACHGPADCHHRPDVEEHGVGVLAYLLALPADTLLVNVRCHV
ncbi:hypothetical protein [Kitasatospora camelliae]|uniref:Uncharacterized protein n=1 Tax=Kitasatospora camelliae TaxID=3156397 RepID=A0AAU8JPZ7_9ACTN